VLLRPRRLTREGRREYERGNHPQALRAFEGAAQARPADPALRFNLADGLYKNGRYGEAATLFRALGSDPAAPLAPAARFNLGDSLYRKQDYRGAVAAYRDALRLAPDDEAARRNLELALRALKEQKEEQQRQQQKQKDQKKGGEDQKSETSKNQGAKDQKPAPAPGQKGPPPRPLTPQEREDERFREETGMPKERAMQLLDALQQNEKEEQKRLLALERAKKKTDKDW
jgi:Ca-activated chloride channel family protein